MAGQSAGIVIKGLPEFRAALRAAEGRLPRVFAAALKAGGEPIIRRAGQGAPSQFGPSLSARVRGGTKPRGEIVSSLPWGGGAEWGRLGKWQGFVRRWGSPPRFVWPAAEGTTEEVQAIIFDRIEEIVRLYGWFR